MRREPLLCDAIEPARRSSDDQYEIHVITPMFGGGVETGECDDLTPIRSTSIRGHLRFWWRATRGAHLTLQKLRETEGLIWGTVDQPSRVRVRVQVTDPGTPETCAEYPPGKHLLKALPNYPPYAIFPFYADPPPRQARNNVTFKLFLEYQDSDSNDVGAALWAWLNFGGIGSRTRRGCGALYCRALAPESGSLLEIHRWVKKKFGEYAVKPLKNPPRWPVLWQYPLTGRAFESPVAAWKRAVELLRIYRQGPETYEQRLREGVGRNPGTWTHPGRSLWPEPDTLRSLTGSGELRHKKTITVHETAFPRAEFGLPIIFHFTANDPDDEPNNCELYPKGKNRMASPLILRPLAFGNGTEAVAMVVRLGVEPLHELELRKIAVDPSLQDSQIRRPDLATYLNSPLKGITTGSALDGFMKFASAKLR